MRFAGLVGLALVMAACVMRGDKSPARAVLRGPAFDCSVTLDGVLDEPCYRRAALEKMGFHLRARERWQAGLFRADFAPGKPDAPDWITWIAAHTPQADFHVAGAFGTRVFDPKPECPPD